MAMTIEKATFDDFKMMVDTSRSLFEWETSYDDYDVYRAAFGDENINFFAAKNEAGKTIGFAGLVKFPSNFAALGAYILLPEYRALGIGSKLFDKVVEDSIREGRNIGLTAEEDMAAKYEKRYGFSKRTSFDIHLLAISNIRISEAEKELAKKGVIGVDEIDVEKIVEFDRAVSGCDGRAGFVKAWTSHPAGRTNVAVDANGNVIGFAVSRRVSEDFFAVAPLYAADDATALKLLVSLIPDDNSARLEILSSSKKSENWKRMLSGVADVAEDGNLVLCFTKAAPEVDTDRLYSIADAVFGII